MMTVNERPDYLRQTLESWQRVRGQESVAFVFMVEPSDVEAQNIALITSTGLGNHLSGTYLNSNRLGPLSNPFAGLLEVFTAGHSYAVVADDDMLVSTDLLEFHQWAAAELRFRDEYLTVCSESPSPLRATGLDDYVVDAPELGSLGWATWRDRWEGLIRDTWDHDYSTGLPNGAEAGFDWNLRRILKARTAAGDTWRTSLRPVESKVQHIGRERGTHCTPEMFPATTRPSFVEDRSPFTAGRWATESSNS